MNRQANYIIAGFLLFLSVSAGIFIVQKIKIPSTEKSYSDIIDPDYSTITVDPLLAKGKSLFLSKCATCHNIFKEGAYPALFGFEERGPWSDKKNIYSWVRNPSAFLEKNEYVKGLRKKFGSTMTAFPDLTDAEIDAIIEYVNGQDLKAIPVAKY